LIPLALLTHLISSNRLTMILGPFNLSVSPRKKKICSWSSAFKCVCVCVCVCTLPHSWAPLRDLNRAWFKCLTMPVFVQKIFRTFNASALVGKGENPALSLTWVGPCSFQTTRLSVAIPAKLGDYWWDLPSHIHFS
jgi:hypothetical protein